MGTTINKIACVTNGWKLNGASHTYSSRTPTDTIGHNIKKKTFSSGTGIAVGSLVFSWNVLVALVYVYYIGKQPKDDSLNHYMDLVMDNLQVMLVENGLDPVALPNTSMGFSDTVSCGFLGSTEKRVTL
ncbi:hypothetical protein E2C01_057134 [Portunus trituberculatus]|uniref:Uncharacterized protein n=1 Tax=Portunus trituberculatus TaxID=210409 RepID=A0A5B7GZ81_PORTR|nr:hypothetical protein [Portunus trituberculatus]